MMANTKEMYLGLRKEIRSPLYETIFNPYFKEEYHGISTIFPSTIEERVYQFGGSIQDKGVNAGDDGEE